MDVILSHGLTKTNWGFQIDQLRSQLDIEYALKDYTEDFRQLSYHQHATGQKNNQLRLRTSTVTAATELKRTGVLFHWHATGMSHSACHVTVGCLLPAKQTLHLKVHSVASVNSRNGAFIIRPHNEMRVASSLLVSQKFNNTHTIIHISEVKTTALF